MWDSETWQCHWCAIREKLHERWPQLSDDELAELARDPEATVAWLQARTGESRETLLGWLADAVAEAAAEEFPSAEPAGSGPVLPLPPEWEASVRLAADWVRRQPLHSLAVAFGAGLFAGVLAARVLRRS